MQTQIRRREAHVVRSPAPALSTFDKVQCAIDVLGLVPGLNVPAEMLSGLISLGRGDMIGFGLSLAGLVPLEGGWAVALKIARTTKQVATAVELSTRIAREAERSGSRNTPADTSAALAGQAA